MKNQLTFLKILGVFLCLYLFLVGIGGLSSGIKGLGGGFAKTVLSTTSNPFTALFIGILCTTLFQSSSTTTSLIVTMASTGALTIGGAVPMIMGANIGTTVTNTLVSIGYIGKGNEFRRAFAASTVHDFFNIMSVMILFPLELMFGFLEKLSLGLGTMLFGVLSTDQAFKSPIKKAVKWGSKKIEYISSYSFIFSPRPGTPAASFKFVEENIAKKRLVLFQKLAEKIKMKYRKNLFNKKSLVLFENKTRNENEFFGRDEYNNSVIVKSTDNLIGKIKEIKIVSGNQNTLKGDFDHKTDKRDFSA